uniref:ATP synthase complex subunit 8 n=1 Tax=Horadandia atukorali TaxID=432411 RepID=F3Y6Q9_9TELE|nr:ATP synthase F0 subunit 8 [Horadandia atukorali]BAK23060.1 ATPase subunit 8 [Horadandia atukorali]
MPQLDPIPWFMIFIFSWAVLLTSTMTKVTNHTQPNEFVTLDVKKYQNPNWTWSW